MLYYRRNAWAGLHLGQPDAFLAAAPASAAALYEAIVGDAIFMQRAEPAPGVKVIFWHHPVYFINDSPYKIYRAASE